MAHPSSPTRHLVDQNTVQKKFLRRRRIVLPSALAILNSPKLFISVPHTVCRYHKQNTTVKISLWFDLAEIKQILFAAWVGRKWKELNERPKWSEVRLNRSRCSGSRSWNAVHSLPFECFVTYQVTSQQKSLVIYILSFLDKVTLALWWDDDFFWELQLECSVVFSSQTVRKLKNIMKLSWSEKQIRCT